VLLIGFGRFGNIVGRMLKANGIPTTILDFDAEQIDALCQLGLKAYYGDATRLEILARPERRGAKLLLIMIDSEEATLRIVDLAQQHFPQAKIWRAQKDRSHAYRLVKEESSVYLSRNAGERAAARDGALEQMGYSTGRVREMRTSRGARGQGDPRAGELPWARGLLPARARADRNSRARHVGASRAARRRIHPKPRRPSCRTRITSPQFFPAATWTRARRFMRSSVSRAGRITATRPTH